MRLLVTGLVCVSLGLLAVVTIDSKSCASRSLSLGETRTIKGGQSCSHCCQMEENLNYCQGGNDVTCVDDATCFEAGPGPWQCEPEFVQFIHHNGVWRNCYQSTTQGRDCRIKEVVVCQTIYYCEDDCREFGPYWVCFTDPLSGMPYESYNHEELFGTVKYCVV